MQVIKLTQEEVNGLIELLHAEAENVGHWLTDSWGMNHSEDIAAWGKSLIILGGLLTKLKRKTK